MSNLGRKLKVSFAIVIFLGLAHDLEMGFTYVVFKTYKNS